RIRGTLYVVSEYVVGASLWELEREAFAQGVPVPLPFALRAVSDALRAAIAARRAIEDSGGSAPRVLFAETIWIAEYGETLLTEAALGSLHAEQLHDERSTELTAQLTPEELAGSACGPRTDVFVAGTLLWELIANRPLFAGDDKARVARSILVSPVPRLDTIERGALPVPRAVADIVAKALDRDPNRRF